jgi:hypothetical protein
MTQGVLLFAQNNSEIDYVQLAIFAAARIKQHLGVPVSVITNVEFDDPIFDKIIVIADEGSNSKQFKDGADKVVKVEWRNTTRSKCFELSPYDETLVIDVDYIVNSDKLAHCWDQPRDFLIYKESYDIGTWRSHAEFEYISDHSIPFYWATVFFFRKTAENELFFTLVEHIKANWAYYKLAYNIYSPNFRNDIAFSVAIHMMNGYSKDGFAGSLPGKLHYIFDFDYLLEIKDTAMKFLVQKDSNYVCLKTNSLDMHVMNKYSLLRCIND